MTGRLLAALLALGAGVFISNAPIEAQRAESDPNARRALSFSGLEPGVFAVHKQTIPVDIVLIGFAEDQVRGADVAAVLPATYTPIVRYPQFYGLQGRDTGLEYTFKYEFKRKGRNFEEQFFRYLTRIGVSGNPTVYQNAYNNQAHNLVDVTGPVLYIDGPSVEKWLARHANPRENGYTIYFVNWYGRDDFKFHAYTKTDDPDPDTGFEFGKLASTAMNSWGGTQSRTWFYDFSAGPEWNTSNWVVDVQDLNGDGTEEYRMPPIWEYAPGGYRAATDLGLDMGLLTRFVAIDLLFTTSPLYDPLVTAPDAFGRKVADITMFEDDPASQGSKFIDPGFARSRWERFQPYYRWKTAFRDIDPIDPGAKLSLDIFAENSTTPDCWTAFGTPFAQLFCFFDQHLADYVPDYPARDYVGEIFAFNTTQEGLGTQLGLLGFADDNWSDGTQTYVFTFDTDLYRSFGYGFTGTTIHEFGHHIGMSHPHDGYDSELGLDYSPAGPLFFAWSGDESDTVMHYLSLTNEFGEHNKDNMYRWETAGYLNWANALAGDIMASPDAPKVFLLLLAADQQAASAKARFAQWNYLSAVERARNSYLLLAEAAQQIGVTSARLSAARMSLPPARIQKYICRPRQLVERIENRTL